MTNKEFMSSFMICNIFYHDEHGKVQITSLPNLNGEVEAFSISYIKPVTINIKDISPSFRDKDIEKNNYIR